VAEGFSFWAHGVPAQYHDAKDLSKTEQHILAIVADGFQKHPENISVLDLLRAIHEMKGASE